MNIAETIASALGRDGLRARLDAATKARNAAERAYATSQTESAWKAAQKAGDELARVEALVRAREAAEAEERERAAIEVRVKRERELADAVAVAQSFDRIVADEIAWFVEVYLQGVQRVRGLHRRLSEHQATCRNAVALARELDVPAPQFPELHHGTLRGMVQRAIARAVPDHREREDVADYLRPGE